MGVASETLAQINREQWSDYKSRFVPLENQLIAAYDNPADKAERMRIATTSAGLSADIAQDVTQRSMARYGQTVNDAGLTRSAGLTKTASMVDAANISRDQLNERDRLLLSGGLTSRGV